MKQNSILIIEDDKIACEKFRNIIEHYENFTLIGFTASSTKAVELTKEYTPDAVILDLELTDKGEGNGIQYLKDLKMNNITPRPFILVTTNNSSNIIFESARQLGVDFFISKHQTDYSEKMVIDFLTTILSSPSSTNLSIQTSDVDNLSPIQRKNRIKSLAIKELNAIGINPKRKGYDYLADSILEAIEHPTALYIDAVAYNYRKTKESVTRAMQNAINTAWTTSDIDDLLNNYTARISTDRNSPTVAEFVRYYASKIRNEL